MCRGSSVVEQRIENPRVGGSIPPRGTTSILVDKSMQEILKQLQAWQIPFTLFEHEAFFTCEDGEWFKTENPGAHVKNLFLRNKKKDKYFLVTVLQEKRMNMKELESKIGGKNVSFGSPEDLMTFLGLTPGAVSPLGLINDTAHTIEFFLDSDVLKEEVVYVHPNVNTATVKLKVADLQRFLEKTGNTWSMLAI